MSLTKSPDIESIAKVRLYKSLDLGVMSAKINRKKIGYYESIKWVGRAEKNRLTICEQNLAFSQVVRVGSNPSRDGVSGERPSDKCVFKSLKKIVLFPVKIS